MAGSRSRSFTRRRGRITNHELVDDTSPFLNPLRGTRRSRIYHYRNLPADRTAALSRLWTITPKRSKSMDMEMAQLRNPHPGEILKDEFLNAIGMSQNQLAHAIGVPGNRIHAIVNGTRVITGDTDLRLCKFFGLSEGYFLQLQNAFDTLEAKRRIAEQVAKIKPYKPEQNQDRRQDAD